MPSSFETRMRMRLPPRPPRTRLVPACLWPMDVVLLHNAKAGDESWSRNDLVKLVRRSGFEPRYFPLQRALQEPKLLERGEFVIVAGGDGAIRKVAMAMIGRPTPLAPLPLGTANNIVRSFGLPVRPKDIVRGWRK